jgi:hypothetical protein
VQVTFDCEQLKLGNDENDAENKQEKNRASVHSILLFPSETDSTSQYRRALNGPGLAAMPS